MGSVAAVSAATITDPLRDTMRSPSVLLELQPPPWIFPSLIDEPCARSAESTGIRLIRRDQTGTVVIRLRFLS